MSQTVFKEPKSTSFVNVDGWIFNDISGKNFQVDYHNHVEGLEAIKCNLN